MQGCGQYACEGDASTWQVMKLMSPIAEAGRRAERVQKEVERLGLASVDGTIWRVQYWAPSFKRNGDSNPWFGPLQPKIARGVGPLAAEQGFASPASFVLTGSLKVPVMVVRWMEHHGADDGSMDVRAAAEADADGDIEAEAAASMEWAADDMRDELGDDVFQALVPYLA